MTYDLTGKYFVRDERRVGFKSAEIRFYYLTSGKSPNWNGFIYHKGVVSEISGVHLSAAYTDYKDTGTNIFYEVSVEKALEMGMPPEMVDPRDLVRLRYA